MVYLLTDLYSCPAIRSTCEEVYVVRDHAHQYVIMYVQCQYLHIDRRIEEQLSERLQDQLVDFCKKRNKQKQQQQTEHEMNGALSPGKTRTHCGGNIVSFRGKNNAETLLRAARVNI